MSCGTCAEQSRQTASPSGSSSADVMGVFGGSGGSEDVQKLDGVRQLSSGAYMCVSCGRFTSKGGVGHTCPNLATTDKLKKSLEKRGLSANGKTDEWYGKVIDEAKENGHVVLRDAVSGNKVIAELGAVPDALANGYKPMFDSSEIDYGGAETPEEAAMNAYDQTTASSNGSGASTTSASTTPVSSPSSPIEMATFTHQTREGELPVGTFTSRSTKKYQWSNLRGTDTGKATKVNNNQHRGLPFTNKLGESPRSGDQKVADQIPQSAYLPEYGVDYDAVDPNTLDKHHVFGRTTARAVFLLGTGERRVEFTESDPNTGGPMAYSYIRNDNPSSGESEWKLAAQYDPENHIVGRTDAAVWTEGSAFDAEQAAVIIGSTLNPKSPFYNEHLRDALDHGNTTGDWGRAVVTGVHGPNGLLGGIVPASDTKGYGGNEERVLNTKAEIVRGSSSDSMNDPMVRDPNKIVVEPSTQHTDIVLPDDVPVFVIRKDHNEPNQTFLQFAGDEDAPEYVYEAIVDNMDNVTIDGDDVLFDGIVEVKDVADAINKGYAEKESMVKQPDSEPAKKPKKTKKKKKEDKKSGDEQDTVANTSVEEGNTDVLDGENSEVPQALLELFDNDEEAAKKAMLLSQIGQSMGWGNQTQPTSPKKKTLDDRVLPESEYERPTTKRPSGLRGQLDQEKVMKHVIVPAPDPYLKNVPAEVGGQLKYPMEERIPKLDPSYQMNQQTHDVMTSISSLMQVGHNTGEVRAFGAFGLAGESGTGKNSMIRQIAASMRVIDDDGNETQGMPLVEREINPQSTFEELVGGVVLTEENGATVSRVKLGPVGKAAASGSIIAVNEIVRNPKLMTDFQSMMEDGEIRISAGETGDITIPVHPATKMFFTWNPGYDGDGDRPGQAGLSRMTAFVLDAPTAKESEKRLGSYFAKLNAQAGSGNEVAVADNSRTSKLRTYKIPKTISPSKDDIVATSDFFSKVRGSANARDIGGSSPHPVAPGPREQRRFLALYLMRGKDAALGMLDVYCDQDPDLFQEQKNLIGSWFTRAFGTQP